MEFEPFTDPGPYSASVPSSESRVDPREDAPRGRGELWSAVTCHRFGYFAKLFIRRQDGQKCPSYEIVSGRVLRFSRQSYPGDADELSSLAE